MLRIALVPQPHVHVNAVGPDVDVLLVREITMAPLLVLLAPLVLKADDDVGLNPLASTPSSDCRASA